MTEPETLRIRIATLEGWRDCYPGTSGNGYGRKPGNHRVFRIPDYTGDSQAIIEAVLRLPVEKQERWALELMDLLQIGPAHLAVHTVLKCATATPLQMSKAFCKIHEDKP